MSGSRHCREKEPALPRAPPHAATPRSDMRPTLEADGNVACAIFSHLEDRRDRIALAAVSRVFRDAEKSDASLPVALGALKRHGDRFLYSSYATAAYWYRKGCDRGDAACMHAIGHCYRYPMSSDVLAKDMTKAVEWTKKASELGHAKATGALGLLYENGKGVDKDEAKAFELNVKAAHSFNLGNLYRHGLCGVAEDKKEALKWFRVAFDIGCDRNYFGSIGFQYLRGICRMLEAELAATRMN